MSRHKREGPADGHGEAPPFQNSALLHTVAAARTQARRRAFGPRIVEIARFLAPEIGTDYNVLALFSEIDRRWPGLSFRDFVGAAVLAEALALKPKGRA